MTVFVLLARNRSGSGALGSLLDRTPSLAYLWEVFHDNFIDRPSNYFCFMREFCKENPDAWMPSQARARFDEYLDYLSSWSKKRYGKPDVLMDMKYNSMHHFNANWLALDEPPTLFKILRDKNVPIIHLRRKNHLRAYVSGLYAHKNKTWHSTTYESITVRSLTINVKDCLDYLRVLKWQDDRVDWILSGYSPQLELEYSELFDLRGRLSAPARQHLADFCCVSPQSIGEPELVKLTPNALDRVIENYAEVESCLRESPYAWMLDD
jgi:hypothetical protein